ncbi:MAG: zinc ribbon domain-containing protein [Ignavibacteriae bacterium]|nr:zinc ribbon domain-containing protein [Ignavibacteriota bacterium]
MPTYDYRCTECGHEFEEFQSMSAETLKTCPNCGKDTLKRAMGTGAGTIFKGGGFYQTDYKNTGGEKKAGKTTSDKKTETKPDKPTETKKSETNSDSKSTKSDTK